MFLQNHKYSTCTKGILCLDLFAALYLSWVLWVHHASGIWVYPIMAHLSPVGLCIFLGIPYHGFSLPVRREAQPHYVEHDSFAEGLMVDFTGDISKP
ncbi:androgen-induced gene 1 protein-like [Myxocyprinus asiaticus]|uniref:androgen-induced gene 1 protein-like n=1 Tax=Myxocyprinus asiaticus TaxID=70543 RepID=UPI002222CD07|nr:androgen-induced gene 1 protein-like [Myxocyprinus asiaticus]